ncbi:MAG: ABC transporter permease [Bacteroidetes bacterium RIFCSPLOWO2_12_FULL_31_6]|nr:MAG: ABC transporter permease [Bacteroidetes bacterium RIFCSPLOWO2_12_FULL_31_6]
MNLKENWDTIIEPKNGLLSLNLVDVWKYRDLLRMFVKRDFVTIYKQTILGPLWFFIQPIFTVIIYSFVFGEFAGIPTDGLPKILFYLSGTICWNYFADCFNKTSSVFRDNQNIFGKVYFPRLITPLSIVVSGLLKLGVQLLLLIAILAYYYFFTIIQLQFHLELLLFPYLIVLMAVLSLGLGMIITSLTTKYRDLVFLLQFGVQLLMYATPVIYPLSSVPEKYQWLIILNPMTSIIETFKYGVLGAGTFSWLYLAYTTMFTIVVLILGTIIFNKTEKTFMDTV